MADTIGFLSSLREKLTVGLSGSQTQLPVTEWSSATLILDVKEEK